MIVPDINLLLYAHNAGFKEHEPARRWWEDQVNGPISIGLPWAVTTGFIRLMTHSRALDRPATPEQAIDYVLEWFEFPHVTPINPGVDHLTRVRRFLVANGVGGNLTTDAHIAAVAMEYQAEVHSNDRDFGRFPGLRWHNPL